MEHITEEDKSIKYEYEENDKKIVILFKEPPIIKDPSTFSRTHYFIDANCTKITTKFKDELLKLLGVSNVNDLKSVIDANNIRLVFEPESGEMSYNKTEQVITVHTKTFTENIIKPANKEKRLKHDLTAILNSQKIPSSNYRDLVRTIIDGANNVELSENDRKILAKEIPELIRSKRIKISVQDVTDMNKQSLQDIVQLGRDLLAKKRNVEKRLCIERKYIGKEYAWQKYFELYGSYLLFGSIEEKIPEKILKAESKLRASNSRLDILTINRYGFLDLVELKRADEYLFKVDYSHDNIVPTSKLSTAISQVNNYLMLLPYDKDNGELTKGAESATGLLIFGSTPYLMSPDDISRYAKKHSMSEQLIQTKLRKALRDLNYSYAHIQITLYDEILDNLENFINQMKIEFNP